MFYILFPTQGGKTPLYIAARGSFTAIVDMIIKTARLEYTPKVRKLCHKLIIINKNIKNAISLSKRHREIINRRRGALYIITLLTVNHVSMCV